jgi:hypothetical protein
VLLPKIGGPALLHPLAAAVPASLIVGGFSW